MEKLIKEINRVNQECPIDVYLSGGNGRLYWPYRLQKAKPSDSTPSVRASADTYILDSGFKGGGVPQDQLISMVHKRQPKYVIPNDAINTDDYDGDDRHAIEETAEKVETFLDRIDETKFPSTVIIPLQPPHELHYAYLHKHHPRQAHRGHFAIGGLKGAGADTQIQAMESIRRVAGYEPYIHGFGFGAAPDIIEKFREKPELIDSVDFSTPQQNVQAAETAGHARIPVRTGLVGGDDQSTSTARLVEFEMTELTRYLNPEKTKDDVKIHWEKYRKMWETIGNKLQQNDIIQDYTITEPRPEDQSGLTEYATIDNGEDT